MISVNLSQHHHSQLALSNLLPKSHEKVAKFVQSESWSSTVSPVDVLGCMFDKLSVASVQQLLSQILVDRELLSESGIHDIVLD